MGVNEGRAVEAMVAQAKYHCLRAAQEADLLCWTGAANDLTSIWAELHRIYEDLMLSRERHLKLRA